MRTSRVARDTARLVNALSPRSARPRNATSADEAASSPTTPQSSPASRKRKRGAEPLTARFKEETVTTTTTTTTPATQDKTEHAGGARPKKARRQLAKKVRGQNGEVKVEPPANWERFFDITRQMRSQWPAPVDTMGCESLAEEHRSPRDQRFQTLVSLMLSSQTKDTVTSVAMKNLQQNLPGGLTLESVLAVEPGTLNELISKVGFHNNKVKFIKAAAEILRTRYNSDIPSTIDGLVSLPGVGPKMAYLCMSAAWGRDEGIGVDVHVHRITNLWGWHSTKQPEETRAALESWLPRDKWHEINTLLVGFGQTWCPPVGRKCDECKLSAEGLCPSAVVSRTVKEKVKRERIVVADGHNEELVNDKEVVDMTIKPVKAEDLGSPAATINTAVQDIEDIGERTRRSRRLGR